MCVCVFTGFLSFEVIARPLQTHKARNLNKKFYFRKIKWKIRNNVDRKARHPGLL